MATTKLSKTGLQKQDQGDKNWETALNSGFDNLEARIGKTYAGDPNKNVAAEWRLQTCYDTQNGTIYVATTEGSSSNAVWEAVPKDSALGTAATKDTGTGSAQVPTNADLKLVFDSNNVAFYEEP